MCEFLNIRHKYLINKGIVDVEERCFVEEKKSKHNKKHLQFINLKYILLKKFSSKLLPK